MVQHCSKHWFQTAPFIQFTFVILSQPHKATNAQTATAPFLISPWLHFTFSLSQFLHSFNFQLIYFFFLHHPSTSKYPQQDQHTIIFRRDSKALHLENWWKLYGCDAPNLQKLAIRILSQTASSSGCERNWSVFERIHTKKRNRLEHQRLNDLVYVHYNLRLQHRFDHRKRSYDPIDYESIDKTEFWVIEEEQDGELNCDELEEELEELPKDDSQLVEDDESEVGEDNDIDLEAFQRRRLLDGDEDNDWLN
ncbi:uncharacterized protein [Coffea arabica]|uniref:HAT C-terminal dimerisation domain-containing protein n=1 Tax=Coffea arabica TaxID=13443 RepID=A0ABM4UQK4_COFAR